MKKFFREIRGPLIWLGVGLLCGAISRYLFFVWLFAPLAWALLGLHLQDWQKEQEKEEFARTHPVIVAFPPDPPTHHPPHVHVHHNQLPH